MGANTDNGLVQLKKNKLIGKWLAIIQVKTQISEDQQIVAAHLEGREHSWYPG